MAELEKCSVLFLTLRKRPTPSANVYFGVLSLHPTDPQTGCQWTSGNSLRTLLREGIVPIVRAVIKLEIRGPHNLTEDLPSAQT